MSIFDDIERTHNLRLGDPTLTICPIFDDETRNRAEALEGPGQLKIILPSDLPAEIRRGLGGRVDQCLCIAFGNKKLIKSLYA